MRRTERHLTARHAIPHLRCVVRGPWRGFDDVEYATLEWVAWFNTQRLLEPLGYVPPTEYEAQVYRNRAAQAGAGLVALK